MGEINVEGTEEGAAELSLLDFIPCFPKLPSICGFRLGVVVWNKFDVEANACAEEPSIKVFLTSSVPWRRFLFPDATGTKGGFKILGGAVMLTV